MDKDKKKITEIEALVIATPLKVFMNQTEKKKRRGVNNEQI